MSKRFHVHLHVGDLARSIDFYNKLFDAQPARRESDYAKWMLDDPPVNFAISTFGASVGIDHLGIQTDDPGELDAMRSRAEAAELATRREENVSCCYARGNKHWITDPQGIAWEHFHTLADVATFSPKHASAAQACCPPRSPAPQGTATASRTGSCG